MTPRISVIVPAVNEATVIEATLAPLQSWRDSEVIVVDGGSTDGTTALAARAGTRTMTFERGRARQMNAGAQSARGDILLFLHADTLLPPQADSLVVAALEAGKRTWGRFDVHIAGGSLMFPLIAAMINWRSRLSGIATGDQALFITRKAFDTVGGFPDQPLMEDIEICKRLKRLSPPACLRERATTSGRRWEKRGVWRTIFLMWRLRFAYWRGAPAAELARLYR